MAEQMIIDLLDAEQLIIDRLNLVAPSAGGRIYSTTDGNQVDAKGKTPLIFIAFNGQEIKAQRADRGAVQLTQNWLVIAVGRTVGGKSAKLSREQVGPVLGEILTGLLGWKPSEDHTELELRDPPDPFYDENAFGYFPLQFSTTKVIRSTN